MNRITTVDLYPDYRTLKIWDTSFEFTRGWDLTDEQRAQRRQQEFSARRWRSLNFTTLGDCMGMTIEVWYADASGEIRVRDDTIRAILVPFSITSGEWIIGSCMEREATLSANLGNHALLFEVKLRDDQKYLSSSQYQEDVSGGFSQEYCYLTLYQRGQADPIKPEVLCVDAWSAPPYNLAAYDRSDLNSAYPSAYWFDW